MLAAMSQRVRSSLSTAVVWLVAGAVAMVGLVWITIWAVGRLSVHVGAWAALLIGLFLFAPLVVVWLARELRAPPAPEPYERFARPAAAAPAPERESLMPGVGPDIGAAVLDFVRRSPFTALALGAVAGFVLSQSSGLISRLLDIVEGEDAG
jgi:hypothetical protein